MTRFAFEQPARAGLNRAADAAHHVTDRTRGWGRATTAAAKEGLASVQSAVRAAPESLPLIAPAALGAVKVVRTQARRHPLLAGVTVAAAAAGIVLANPAVRAKLAQLRARSRKPNLAPPPAAQRSAPSYASTEEAAGGQEAHLDEDLEATFPASDPVGAKRIT